MPSKANHNAHEQMHPTTRRLAKHLRQLGCLTALALSSPAPVLAQDQQFCGSFAKNTDGSWTALDSTEIPGLGRKLTIRRGSVLRPGATILSIDMAALLDEKCPAVLPASPEPPPQPDLQQRFGDASGNIDVTKLTCAQLVSSYQEDADFVALWASGWHSGLARQSEFNMTRLKQTSRAIIAYCQANKDKRLTHAVDAALGQAPAQGPARTMRR